MDGCSTLNTDALPISLSHRPIWEISANYTACEGLYPERSLSSQVRWVPALHDLSGTFRPLPSEAFLSCNARLLARVGREPSFEYDFSLPSSWPPTLFSLPVSIPVHSITLANRKTWCSLRRDTCSLLGVNPFVHIVIGVVGNRPTIVIINSVIVIQVQAWRPELRHCS